MGHEEINFSQVASANSVKPYEPPTLVELEIADTEVDSNPGDDGLGVFTQS